MQRRGFTLIEMLMIVAVVAMIAVVVYPMFRGIRDPPSRTGECSSNLKQLGLAIQQYNQDNGGRFPSVVVNPAAAITHSYNTPYGWADGIWPYVKNTTVYQCPTEGRRNERGATQSGFTDYWMNTRLSDFPDVKLTNPADVVLLGEGNAGEELTDARYAKRQLPFAWLQNTKSPLYRHNGGANFLFADAHAKFIPANRALDVTFQPALKTKR